MDKEQEIPFELKWMEEDYPELIKELIKVMSKLEALKQIEELLDYSVGVENATLSSAFVWVNSPQGHYHWMDIANKIYEFDIKAS